MSAHLKSLLRYAEIEHSQHVRLDRQEMKIVLEVLEAAYSWRMTAERFDRSSREVISAELTLARATDRLSLIDAALVSITEKEK